MIRLCNFVHSGKSMAGYAWSLWPKACSIHYFYQTDTESLVWLRVSKGPIQVHRNRIVAIRRRTTKCTFNDLNLVRSGCRSIRCIRVWWRLQSWLQSWLQSRPREKEICTYIGRTRGLFTASIFAFVSAHYTLYTVHRRPYVRSSCAYLRIHCICARDLHRKTRKSASRRICSTPVVNFARVPRVCPAFFVFSPDRIAPFRFPLLEIPRVFLFGRWIFTRFQFQKRRRPRKRPSRRFCRMLRDANNIWVVVE